MKTLLTLFTLAAALSAGDDSLSREIHFHLLAPDPFAGEPLHTSLVPAPYPPPAAANVGLSVTSAMIMWRDSTDVVPCVACVPGSGVFNIGIGVPVSHLFTLNTYKWLITYNSDGFTGPCVATLAIVQEGAVLASSSTTQMCRSLESYVSWSTFNLPGGTSGAATLIGQIKAVDGSIVAKMTVPIVIE